VDVYNGGTTPGLAAGVSAALVKDGYRAGKIANASSQLTTTEVLYGAGTSASATKIASLFSVTATASSAVAAGHVEILLGASATLSEATATPSPSSSSSSSAGALPATGPQGGAVSAQDGIPCVN
jgi:LytR cell envelope-related transcriptional attenuator